jgi:hypothetical protein
MIRQTSKDVYRQIVESGALTPARMKVYGALFEDGPMTGAELDGYLAKSGGRGHFHKRLSELRDQGVVREVGKRRCTVSGKDALAWDVTDRLPTNQPRKQKSTNLRKPK